MPTRPAKCTYAEAEAPPQFGGVLHPLQRESAGDPHLHLQAPSWKVHPGLNAVTLLCPLPVSNCGFVSAVVWDPVSLI